MKTYACFLVILFSAFSCKKVKEPKVEDDFKECLVEKSIYKGVFNQKTVESTYSYVYDTKGRIIKNEITSGGTSYIRTYEYLVNGIKSRYETLISTRDFTDKFYEFDDIGRISKVLSTNNSPNGQTQGTTTYSYDSNGYLATIIDIFGTKTTLTWENGNLVRYSRPNQTETYTYTSEAFSQNEFDFAKYQAVSGEIPLEYFGKPSKNLLKTSQRIYSNSISYTFEKDAKGKIISMRNSDGDTGSFIYVCR